MNRRSFLTTGAAATLAGLTGCAGGGGGDGGETSPTVAGDGTGTTTGTAGDSGRPTIRFTFTQGTEIAAPYPIYLRDEFFRENVLSHVGDTYEVSITGTQGTSLAASGMGAGEFDGGLLAFSSFANATIRDVVPSGMTIVMPLVWQLVSDLGFADTFASLQGSGITDFDDLEGTNFAVNAAGSGVDIAARVALRQHDIDPESDLNIREVGFGAMGSQLTEERIDVGAFVQPLWEFIRADAQPVFDVSDAFGNLLAWFGAFRTEFVEENPEAIRGFIEDNWDAVTWLSDDANRETALDVLGDHIEMDRPLLEAAVFDRGYYWSQDGYHVNPEFIQPGIDGMVETGYLDSAIDIDQYIDNSYLPDAADMTPDPALSG